MPDSPLGRRKISAIIACYRDAPAIPIMHERLVADFTKLDVDYEIIFVNDASPDNAAEVLADLADRDAHVTVVTHSRNFGSQSAFTSGMRICTGDAVVLLDGDLQDPPELIEAFYESGSRDMTSCTAPASSATRTDSCRSHIGCSTDCFARRRMSQFPSMPVISRSWIAA